ncbi:MAG: PaaI family thioesterase [Alphaproteobacteria bacterium]|nr:PaaI family thioesterase [Alphaproteobacteria bacterium]
MPIDRDNPDKYPPNIQAILKRPAAAAVVLGQELIDVDKEAGTVRVAYNATETLANRFGAIHGGMTAAMLDDVISLAAGLSIEWGQITPTLEMKVSYIAQGRPGTRIQAEARTIRRGGTVIFLEADLKDETGKLLATASSTVMIAQMKK